MISTIYSAYFFLSFQFQNEGLCKIETPRINEEYENQFLGAREKESEREREHPKFFFSKLLHLDR
jgi:hypothetical protein